MEETWLNVKHADFSNLSIPIRSRTEYVDGSIITHFQGQYGFIGNCGIRYPLAAVLYTRNRSYASRTGTKPYNAKSVRWNMEKILANIEMAVSNGVKRANRREFEIGDLVERSGQPDCIFEVVGCIHDTERLFVIDRTGRFAKGKEFEMCFAEVSRQFRAV
jgi:hypothetical protein